MIASLYDETVQVKRLGFVEESETKQTFVTHLSDVPCHIQALDSDITQDISVGFGKDLLMFCANADIREGDRVDRTVGEVTTEYKVVGLENFNNFPQRSIHMELRIRAFKS